MPVHCTANNAGKILACPVHFKLFMSIFNGLRVMSLNCTIKVNSLYTHLELHTQILRILEILKSSQTKGTAYRHISVMKPV